MWLDGIKDPGNIGTIIRSAHALCDGPVIIGPRCADPYGPKAVRASMGSIFARPPARAHVRRAARHKVALDRDAPQTLREIELDGPVVVMVGAEREGLGPDALKAADVRRAFRSATTAPTR